MGKVRGPEKEGKSEHYRDYVYGKSISTYPFDKSRGTKVKTPIFFLKKESFYFLQTTFNYLIILRKEILFVINLKYLFKKFI